MGNSIIIGCDIGGSHISTALVDLNINEVVGKSFFRKSINSHASPDEIIDLWCSCIESSVQSAGVQIGKIGIAMPGPLDYEKGICLIQNQDKYEQLYGLNLKDLIANRLLIPVDDIAMINDASSFLQGEMLAGAGSGYAKSIGLTLGTGLGSAIYANHTAIDAELWNYPYFDGIAEDYLSTRWFTKSYYDLSGDTVDNVKDLLAIDTQRELILGLFDTFAKNLSEFIFNLLYKESPEVIILGGNITKAENLFVDKTVAALVAKGCTVPVKIANLGEMSAIYGAAGIWNSVNSI